MDPTFTPPSVTINTPASVGGIFVGSVTVSGNPYRSYTGGADISEDVSIVRALEMALHTEWAMLQQQKAVVKQIAHALKTRRKALDGTR